MRTLPNMATIVLVCLENFQDYLLDNLQQLQDLQVDNIYVVTNQRFFWKFHRFMNVQLVAVEDLRDHYRFYEKTSLDKSFRGGFWTLTSLRFFYLHACIKQYNLTNVIHLENDVLIYHHPSVITQRCNPQYLYIPFDTYQRNIASVVFIPNHSIFEQILNHYDFSKNDMENFRAIREKTGLIKSFPIFPLEYAKTDEEQFVSENFGDFGGVVFDAAAIGQYIGGVDPRNISGDTSGFVNETCVIKYNQYRIIWETYDGKRLPYLVIDGYLYPIYNLHIHSKNLKKFMRSRHEGTSGS